jgi:hypothetical protein
MDATTTTHESHIRPRRVKAAALAVWAAILVVGFALVFTLGAPLPTTGEQRTDAHAPLTLPVTEASAIAAAEQLVRLEYPEYLDARRSVRKGTSQGEEIWTVTYSRPDPVSGVRITISGRTGEIQAGLFP